MKNSFKSYIVQIITWQARIYLAIAKPKIVAITGSVGKTTTKNMIHAALVPRMKVAAARKSFNSEIGVPLTILQLPNGKTSPLLWTIIIIRGLGKIIAALLHDRPEVIVCEVGTDGPGDITSITQWLKPDISVFTALAKDPVHLEFFPNREALFNEKKQLAIATKLEGAIIYNADDQFLPELLADTRAKKFSFGRAGQVKLVDSAVSLSQTGIGGTKVTLEYGRERGTVDLRKVLGEGYLMATTAAAAVAIQLGVPFYEIIENIATNFIPEPGRGKVLKGKQGSVVIDETYNSSPKAVRALLETVTKIPSPPLGRKILVLGDMKELGKREAAVHRQIGAEAAQTLQGGDIFITVGILAKEMQKGAIDAGMLENYVNHFDTADEAGAYILGILKPADVVAAKGSRHSIRLERALVQIVEPEEKPRLVQDYI